MKKNNLKTEEDMYAELMKHPILFVEVMWDLVPQPLRPQFEAEAQEAIDDLNWRAFKKRWFQPFIKGEHMTWQQWVILLSIEAAVAGRASKRISIRSGHGIGKDCTLAWVILWFLFVFKDAQVPCTAPTGALLADVLWKEIAKWHRRMPEEVKAKYEMQSEYIRMVEHPKEWFARATTGVKENPEALAGVHGDHLLRVSDEASGVADEIYNTAEGAMTSSESYFILISNATRLDGYFYESQTTDDRFQRLAFNGEDSPIVDRDYVEGIENRHGRDSDEFRKRVLGEFPQMDIEMDGWTPILSKEEVDLAIVQDGYRHAGLKSMGVDVAEGGGGDESVIAVRSLNLAQIVFASNRTDNIELAGEVIVQQREEDVNPANTGVDSIGVGNGTYKALIHEKKTPQGVNVTNDALDPLLYDDLKAEGYWKLREWIKRGGKLISSKDSEGKERWHQLAKVRYKTTDASGKIMIMPKSMMRRKGIGSPDAAEALMMTFVINLTHDKQITKEDIFFMRKMLAKKNKKKR